MMPMGVTVHDSDNLVFASPGEYYKIKDFEILAAEVAEQQLEDTVCTITVHCTGQTAFTAQLVLKHRQVVSFQCFCANYMHLYGLMKPEEISESTAQVYDYISQIHWTRH